MIACITCNTTIRIKNKSPFVIFHYAIWREIDKITIYSYGIKPSISIKHRKFHSNSTGTRCK